MTCRTSPPKSAWNCATNMSSATARPTKTETENGGRSRSSCARPKACPHSTFMRKPDTTRPRSESRRFAIPFLGILLGLIFSWGGDAFARQDGQQGKDQRIRAEVNLVVLHATVID